jgi:hypothetical protein
VQWGRGQSEPGADRRADGWTGRRSGRRHHHAEGGPSGSSRSRTQQRTASRPLCCSGSAAADMRRAAERSVPSPPHIVRARGLGSSELV